MNIPDANTNALRHVGDGDGCGDDDSDDDVGGGDGGGRDGDGDDADSVINADDESESFVKVRAPLAWSYLHIGSVKKTDAKGNFLLFIELPTTSMSVGERKDAVHNHAAMTMSKICP